MPANDNPTYQQRLGGEQAERTLLSLDRAQKFDLLLHLLTNLQQSLLVCGPEGIGKSTLLQTLQDRRGNPWPICLLQGSSALSFERIVSELCGYLKLGRAGFDLPALRSYCETQKVVLIIDDAGDLVPGLIGELVDLADALAGLRLVFSMTYDQFHIKSASDKSIEDCHLIELPPLNIRQCGEYLQHLATQPAAMLSLNAVTDHLIAELYRKTHGIPGKILAELLKFDQHRPPKQGCLGLWLGIALIVAASSWIVKTVLLSERPEEAFQTEVAPASTEEAPAPAKPTESVVSQPPAATSNNAPKILARETPTPATANSATTIEKPDHSQAQTPPGNLEQQESVAETPQPDNLEHKESPAAAEPAASTQPEKPAEPAPVEPDAESMRQAEEKTAAPISAPSEIKPASADGRDWITAQPADHYTVQLMVLSSQSSAERFLKKYPEHRDKLKYYTIDRNGSEKYVLIFGSFASAADAKRYTANMPSEFSRGITKKLQSIQKEIRR